jgi:Putative Ig domain
VQKGQSTTISITPATDNNGLALSYSASGLPTGLRLVSSPLEITGVAGANDVNTTYSVTITASDSRSSTSRTFTLKVAGSGTQITPPLPPPPPPAGRQPAAWRMPEIRGPAITLGWAEPSTYRLIYRMTTKPGDGGQGGNRS